MKNEKYIHNQIKLKHYNIAQFLDSNNKNEIIKLVYYILEQCYYLNLEMILYSSLSTLKKLKKEDWKKIIYQINETNDNGLQEEYHVSLFTIIGRIEQNCFIDENFLLYIGFPESLVKESTKKFYSHNSSRVVPNFIGPLTSVQYKIKMIKKKILPNLTSKERGILYYMFTDCFNIKNKELKIECQNIKRKK